MKKKKLVLIGFPGSGKSYLGKRIAKELNFHFFDLDGEIEKQAGISISEFFERFGEIIFREKEKEVFDSIITKENIVISVGGGFVCYPDRTDYLNSIATVIWLDVPFETCYSRIKQDGFEKRPKIKNKLQVESLYKERIKFYNKAQYRITFSPTQQTDSFEQFLAGVYRILS